MKRSTLRVLLARAVGPAPSGYWQRPVPCEPVRLAVGWPGLVPHPNDRAALAARPVLLPSKDDGPQDFSQESYGGTCP